MNKNKKFHTWLWFHQLFLCFLISLFRFSSSLSFPFSFTWIFGERNREYKGNFQEVRRSGKYISRRCPFFRSLFSICFSSFIFFSLLLCVTWIFWEKNPRMIDCWREYNGNFQEVGTEATSTCPFRLLFSLLFSFLFFSFPFSFSLLPGYLEKRIHE